MFINVNYCLQHFLFNGCGRSIYTVLRHILTVTLFMSRQNSITWRHVNITVLIASINNLRYVGTEFQDINYEGFIETISLNFMLSKIFIYISSTYQMQVPVCLSSKCLILSLTVQFCLVLSEFLPENLLLLIHLIPSISAKDEKQKSFHKYMYLQNRAIISQYIHVCLCSKQQSK